MLEIKTKSGHKF